jgi:hypothetical protein
MRDFYISQGKVVEAEAVSHLIEKRFGKNEVGDPSDLEEQQTHAGTGS